MGSDPNLKRSADWGQTPILYLFALGYFVALAGIFLSKLIPHWNMLIPGGLEDTRLFLWNAWWFHHAISVLHANPYKTTMLFYPFGCDLISHDFPLWMNLLTFMGQKAGLSMVGASNLWFAVSWVLAGFCMYGLAKEATGNAAAGIVAGTYVMTNSYTLARAMQNWGQFNLYAIALFLWLLLRARRKKTTGAFILAGIALAWTAACHYYFLIYSTLIWLSLAAYDLVPMSFQFAWTKEGRRTKRIVFLVIAAMGGLGAAAIVTHPGNIELGGLTIGLHGPENALFVMWISLYALAATYVHVSFPRKRESTMDPRFHGDDIKRHIVLAVTAGILLSPLIIASLKLALAGGYPKQSILWKHHLPGANLFALFFPNPIHAIWGQAVSHWYTVRGMNAQEQAASIGWVCLVVVLMTRRQSKWLWLAIASTILAMGTHLFIAQYNTWCPLPFFVYRLIPVLGNVRVPERWMAVGSIAWGVVLAMALTKRRPWTVALVAALILFENWPGVPYAQTAPIYPIYQHLRELPAGAVLPVPFFVEDSSIGTGAAVDSEFIFPWDHLWAQTQHEKPILGGYIGRISKNLIYAYKENPFIHAVLDLEENDIVAKRPEPIEGEKAIGRFGFRYVLLYPQSTTPGVRNYVLGSLPLKLLEHSDSIELYEVRSATIGGLAPRH